MWFYRSLEDSERGRQGLWALTTDCPQPEGERGSVDKLSNSVGLIPANTVPLTSRKTVDDRVEVGRYERNWHGWVLGVGLLLASVFMITFLFGSDEPDVLSSSADSREDFLNKAVSLHEGHNSVATDRTTWRLDDFEEVSELDESCLPDHWHGGVLSRKGLQDKCKGAPYLYLTYHGGKKDNRVHNVCRYTRDGCPAGAVLLKKKKKKHSQFWQQNYDPKSLRSMAIGHHGEMFLGESWKKASKILRYSDCIPHLDDRRVLESIVADSKYDDRLVHFYGFALDHGLYVTTQATSDVLRFSEESLTMHAKPELFHHSSGRPGLRGVAVSRDGTVYVADKWKGILVLSASNGTLTDTWDHIPKPIGVWYSKLRNSIFVGSSRTHTVYELDVKNRGQERQHFKHHKLRHPAGIVNYGDDLFVVSQRKHRLVKFSLLSGKYEGTVLRHLPDDGELLALSSC